MSRWVQEKKKGLAAVRLAASRAGHSPSGFDETAIQAQIDNVERVISSIPPKTIAQRAVDCGSYARALFHWEHFIRDQNQRSKSFDREEREEMYEGLQKIYAEIDEPDGLEGLSAQLNILTAEQHALQNRRSGQWAAAQSWYEITLAQLPRNHDLQVGLLDCLKESGQHRTYKRNRETEIQAADRIYRANTPTRGRLDDSRQ